MGSVKEVLITLVEHVLASGPDDSSPDDSSGIRADPVSQA
jgi:hypothetical protein